MFDTPQETHKVADGEFDQIEDQPPLTYEQSLAFSQGIRRKIVASKMKGGVPRDNDDIKILLTTLKDHDHTAINDKKNSIEESTSASSAEIAQSMVEVVKLMKNENPFSVRTSDGSLNPDHVPRAILPQLDESKLGDHELVNGEGEIGVVQETSESFFSRMGINPGGKGKD
jgi:hypothetical protein